MSDLPSLQQSADYLAAALLFSQQPQQPPHPIPPPAMLEQHWTYQHYQQQLQQHAMDVSELGHTSGAAVAATSPFRPVPSQSGPSGVSSSSSSSASASPAGTPSPPRPRSSVRGQRQQSSAAAQSPAAAPVPAAALMPPYLSGYQLPPVGVTLATPIGPAAEGSSPPPSGHWLNGAHLPLPYTSSLSRSTSSSLPLSSTSVSPPLLQHNTPPPSRLQRRNMGPPMSANVSPATPHSLQAPSSGGSLHSSSPITSPDLPPLHPHPAQSLLPPVPPLTAIPIQQQQQQGGGAAQLPPFHPSPSSHSFHSSHSHSQASQSSASVLSPPSLQVPRSRGQSASSLSSSSSASAPNSPTPLQHHIPSCTLTLDGHFQDANPAFLATFQFFTLSALQQQSIYSIVHPSEHLSFMVMMRRIMTGKVRSLAQEKLCVPVSHGSAASRPIPMWLMMSAVTCDERLLTLYCCFLPKPRREESEEDEREKAELQLELEGRAQLQQAQLELQDEMLRIERMYQQQFAALSQQQHRYGITQTMVDQYSATAAAQSSSSSAASSTPPPRDPSQLSLSGLPKPQQLHLQQLQQTNNELKLLQAQHTNKLTRFMQALARQSPIQAALGGASGPLFAPSSFGSRSYTAPSLGGSGGGLTAQHVVSSDLSRTRTGGGSGEWSELGRSGEDVKMAALPSPSSTMSAASSVSLPHVRSFSQSFASTTGVDTPSPFSDSPYSRASSALLSSSTSAAV